MGLGVFYINFLSKLVRKVFIVSEILFNIGDCVVYPAHGVGEIIGEETQIIGGIELRVFIIALMKDKVILRVPVKRANSVGLRHLSSLEVFHSVFGIFQAKAKPPKGMWSKRAQEYETKINSGSVTSLAEVIRDLYKNSEDPSRSYSERVIYESALNRLAGEFAVIKGIAIESALTMLLTTLEERAFAA